MYTFSDRVERRANNLSNAVLISISQRKGLNNSYLQVPCSTPLTPPNRSPFPSLPASRCCPDVPVTSCTVQDFCHLSFDHRECFGVVRESRVVSLMYTFFWQALVGECCNIYALFFCETCARALSSWCGWYGCATCRAREVVLWCRGAMSALRLQARLRICCPGKSHLLLVLSEAHVEFCTNGRSEDPSW